MAETHGRPWTPYQWAAAEVISELTPTGGYAHPIAVILLPRQTGKTTLVHDLAVGRCLVHRDYRAAYAAQTGHVTTERMAERIEDLESGPLAGRIKLRRSQGTERITLPGRSFLKAFPPKPGALRSNALDLVIVDEAQEHSEILGEQLDLTILPVFSTRPRRQLILIATAGTDASAYLARYLAAGRAGTTGYVVVEYGARDGEDTDDEALWPLRHPGLAYGLTDVEALRTSRRAMGRDAFAREYFNVWTRTTVRVFDPADWAAVQDPAARPGPAGLCLAFDVTLERDGATIAAADPAGRVTVIEQRPGLDWLVPRLLELQHTHRAPVAADRWGSAGASVDELQRAGAEVLLMGAGDVAVAAAGFLDAVTHRALAVVPSPALDAAVDGAATRPLGDSGGIAWSRRGSAAPVAALIAASNALWGARHAPDPGPKPAAHAG